MVVLVVPVLGQVALEVDVDNSVGLLNKPAFAAGEPVVGKLGLPAVLDLLLENAVLIADRVAHSGISVGSETVQIAGGKSAQTAVSKTCVRLILIDTVKVDIPLLEDILNHAVDVKVEKACFQGTSHKELHGKVVNLFFARGMSLCAELAPPFAEYLDHYRREGLIDLHIRSVHGSNAVLGLEHLSESFFKFVFRYNRNHLNLLQSVSL